jgi:hypothetical protein
MKMLMAYKRTVRNFVLLTNTLEGSDFLFLNVSGQSVLSSRVHVMMKRFLKLTKVPLAKGKTFKCTTVRKVLFTNFTPAYFVTKLTIVLHIFRCG